MTIRKLAQKEHSITRSLWEEVFPEDSKQFLDYYYSYVASDNTIYVAQIDDKIVSMIHLNPYRMQIGKRVEMTHYIVAVGTKKEYRSKGLMTKLMHTVLEAMYADGEPFTFLMPVSEKLYAPFDFVTVCKANIYRVNDPAIWFKTLEREGIVCTPAISADCEDIAKFATKWLRSQYDSYTIRSSSYYKRLLAEQKSQLGGVCVLRKGAQMIGFYAYAEEDGYQIREIIVDKAFRHIVMNDLVLEKANKMMVKMLCTENLGTQMNNIFLNETV